MAYRAEHLMMVAAILLTMILYMEAAPRSGRCTYTAEDWEDIIFTKCGRRSKRSTDTTLSLAVKGEIYNLPLLLGFNNAFVILPFSDNLL